MTTQARPRRTWGDLGREDAEKLTYRPPVGSSQARMAYQYGWEEAASDAAWAARMRGE